MGADAKAVAPLEMPDIFLLTNKKQSKREKRRRGKGTGFKFSNCNKLFGRMRPRPALFSG